MEETLKHIAKVQSYLSNMIRILIERSENHDKSKLEYPEFEYFEKYGPLLRDLKYNSKEYNDQRALMAPALIHHYKNNRHHPEYYPNGIHGMTLIDLLEMICDWKATTNGDIRVSIEENQKRYGYSDELKTILYNTLEFFDND